MPIFNDSENKQPLPAGDYIVCVLTQEKGLSKAGDVQYKLKLEVEGRGQTLHDYLTDSTKAGWRIDTFVKSCGVTVPKGEGYSLSHDEATERKWHYVRTAGLRGWATLKVNEKGYNEVAAWITNKEKLPRRAAVVEAADVPGASKPVEDDIPF